MTTAALAPRVGFVGLGTMGATMARRLLLSGYEVVAWNRSDGPLTDLVAEGAIRASTVSDVFATGKVFSILSNEAAVFETFTEEILAAAPAGAIHVNMATVSASAGTRLAELHAAAGVQYLAAPVLGRWTAAEQGNLSIMVAGSAEVQSQVSAELSILGRRTWDFGTDHSDANVVKIAMNYLIIHAIQAIAEAVTMLEHRDIDAARFIELASDSLFPGAVYAGYGAAVTERRYEPAGFTTRLGLKDLLLAVSAAEESGVVLPAAGVLRDVFESAVARGQGEMDWASIAEITRERSA